MANLWTGITMALGSLDSVGIIPLVSDVRAELTRQAQVTPWAVSFLPGDVTITLKRRLSKSSVEWCVDGVVAMALIRALEFTTLATVNNDTPID
jgi:hypothetical protein